MSQLPSSSRGADLAKNSEQSLPDQDTSSDAATERLVGSLEQESDGLWQQHPVAAILTLTLPLSLFALAAAFAALAGGTAAVGRLAVAIGTALAAGRLVILGGRGDGAGLGFSSLELALIVLSLDIIWAIVVTLHAGLLFHVPWVGPRLKAAVQGGTRLVQNHRWMRRITYLVVLAFVMLPVSSTGSVGGSFLGRFLGLTPRSTLFTVFLGSILGCGLMYFGSVALRPYFDNIPPILQYSGIALIAVCLMVMFGRYRQTEP